MNARPLTVGEWREQFEAAGLRVVAVHTAPMALLRLGRNLADEGLGGTLRIIGNVLRDGAARRRVLQMRQTFNTYREHLIAVSIIAELPQEES